MDDRAHCAAEDHVVASMEEVRQSSPKLDRRAIEQILSTGKRLLVQGAMGIHASDGLSGKVAAMNTLHLVGHTRSIDAGAPERARDPRRARGDARRRHGVRGTGQGSCALMAAAPVQDRLLQDAHDATTDGNGRRGGR